MRTHIKKNIWIIGASTGIGRALALELDRQGANLILSARNAAQLNLVNNELENRHHVIPLDVTDVTSLAAAADSLQNLLTPLDSVIFMAGAYQPMRFDKIDLTTRDHIIATNLTGALNTVHVVLPLLRAQKHGQIALCGSVAGYRGLPGAQPYGATKAALINIAESLKAETKGQNIDIKLINPGFVRTPMTDKNDFTMPMMIEPAAAARAIAKGLLSNRFEIHFPFKFTILLKIARLLPAALYFRIVPR